MPDRTSGLRIARDQLSVSGAATESAEMDFNLSEQGGIEIMKVVGEVFITTFNVTSLAPGISGQTLHARIGTLETTSYDTTDGQQLDSEIFYRQIMLSATFDGTTEAAAMILLSPPDPIDYEDRTGRGMFFARNITHRVQGTLATEVRSMAVAIYYYFVKYSLSELGILFARNA